MKCERINKLSYLILSYLNDLEDFLLEVLILEDVGEAGILADRLAKLRNNLLPVTCM